MIIGLEEFFFLIYNFRLFFEFVVMFFVVLYICWLILGWVDFCENDRFNCKGFEVWERVEFRYVGELEGL